MNTLLCDARLGQSLRRLCLIIILLLPGLALAQGKNDPNAFADSLFMAIRQMPLEKRYTAWSRLIVHYRALRDSIHLIQKVPVLEQDLKKMPSGPQKARLLSDYTHFYILSPHPKVNTDALIRRIEEMIPVVPAHERAECTYFMDKLLSEKYKIKKDFPKAEGYVVKVFNYMVSAKRDTLIHEFGHFWIRQFYSQNNYASPLQLKLAEELLEYAHKHFLPLWLAETKVIVGEVYFGHNQPDKANQLIAEGLATIEKLMPGTIHMMNDAGFIFTQNGNYPLALRYQRKLFWHLIKDYKVKGDYTKSSLTTCPQCNVDIAQYAINISETFMRMKQSDSAMFYSRIAENYAKAAKHNVLIMAAKHRIARAYYEMKDFRNYIPASRAFLADYQKYAPQKKAEVYASNYLNMHRAFQTLAQKDSAEHYLQKGIRYYDSVPKPVLDLKINRFYNEMLYYRQSNPEKALRSADSLIFYKDSVIRQKDKLKISDALMRYDTESRDNQIKLLNQEKQLADLQSRHKNFLIGGVAALLLLAVGVVGLLFARNRSKQRTNKLLASQNAEIQKMNHELADAVGTIQLQNEEISNAYEELNATLEQVQHQKEEIVHKNQKIEDSIRYAYQIQTAILPDDAYLKALLPHHFIFYQPKDIVSGDFYWVTERENLIFFCIADCTGHGVPGAFMSVVGSNALHNVINELGITEPEVILYELDRKIRHTLRQEKSSESKDGMDVCLCVWDKSRNLLQFAGAGRPLYHLSNGNLSEIKGDKFPIGGGQHENKTFTAHHLSLQSGDRIYLFSDGITDQFGGANKKKFTPKRLQEFILNHQSLTISEQGALFHQTMHDWMRGQVQLDDLTLMAVAF